MNNTTPLTTAERNQLIVDLCEENNRLRADLAATRADDRPIRDTQSDIDEIARLRADLAAANARENETFQKYVDANEARIDAEADLAAARELLREASVYLDDVDGTGPLDLQCRIDAALKGDGE